MAPLSRQTATGSPTSQCGSGTVGACKVSSPASSVTTSTTRSSTPGRIDGMISSGRRQGQAPLASPEQRATPTQQAVSPGARNHLSFDSPSVSTATTPPGGTGNTPSGASLAVGCAEGVPTGAGSGPLLAPANMMGPGRAATVGLSGGLDREDSGLDRMSDRQQPAGVFSRTEVIPGQRNQRGMRSPEGRRPMAGAHVPPPERQNPRVPPKVVQQASPHSEGPGLVTPALRQLLSAGGGVQAAGHSREEPPRAPVLPERAPGERQAQYNHAETVFKDIEFARFSEKEPQVKAAVAFHVHHCFRTNTSLEAVRTFIDEAIGQCQYSACHLVIALIFLKRWQAKHPNVLTENTWRKDLHVALHLADCWHPYDRDAPLKGSSLVQHTPELLGDHQLWDASYQMLTDLDWKLMISDEEFKRVTENFLNEKTVHDTAQFQNKTKSGLYRGGLTGNTQHRSAKSAPHVGVVKQESSMMSPKGSHGHDNSRGLPDRHFDNKGREEDLHHPNGEGSSMLPIRSMNSIVGGPPRPGLPGKMSTRVTVPAPTANRSPNNDGGNYALGGGRQPFGKPQALHQEPARARVAEPQGQSHTGLRVTSEPTKGRGDPPGRTPPLGSGTPGLQTSRAGLSGSRLDVASATRQPMGGSPISSAGGDNRSSAPPSSRSPGGPGAANPNGAQRRELSGPAGTSQSGASSSLQSSRTPRHQQPLGQQLGRQPPQPGSPQGMYSSQASPSRPGMSRSGVNVQRGVPGAGVR